MLEVRRRSDRTFRPLGGRLDDLGSALPLPSIWHVRTRSGPRCIARRCELVPALAVRLVAHDQCGRRRRDRPHAVKACAINHCTAASRSRRRDASVEPSCIAFSYHWRAWATSEPNPSTPCSLRKVGSNVFARASELCASPALAARRKAILAEAMSPPLTKSSARLMRAATSCALSVTAAAGGLGCGGRARRGSFLATHSSLTV